MQETIPFSAMHDSVSAAAAKSLQSCPTLCDPIDSSPPGSSAHGILQARILEWVAISFSECICSFPHIREREFLPFPSCGTELRVMMTGLQGYHAEIKRRTSRLQIRRPGFEIQSL